MIPVRDRDVVVARTTTDGRFLLFTSTDVQPGWTLPWWGVVVDISGDAFGLLARLDEDAAPSGWTARQLLLIARKQLAAEAERCATAITRDAVAALDRAADCRWEMTSPAASAGASIEFLAGAEASPYHWTAAVCGEFELRLCPDPQSRGEGITPEQLLIVIDQLLRDAARARPHVRGVWEAGRHVTAALAAEVRRLEAVRA